MKRMMFLLGLWGALAVSAGGQTSYTLTDLGATIGASSYAQGINNHGQVVGYWESTNGAHAFLYQGGVVTDLGLLGVGVTNNYALSINNAGQVVGFSETTNGSRAFLYQNGSMTNLGNLGGWGSYAFGINQKGQIVGYVDTELGALAILYDAGVVIGLGTLGGTNSYAYGVNDELQVAGSSLLTDNETSHAFLWQNGVISDLNEGLAVRGEWELIDAHGINDAGAIAGRGFIHGQEHGFLFQSGGVVDDLGLLAGGTNSYALGVNNWNQVVGASSTATGNHAVAWRNGTMIDLNDAVNATGWELREACGINDMGQIVGWGVVNGQGHAFLLTPILNVSKKALNQPAAPMVNGTTAVTITNPVNNVVYLTSTNVTFSAPAVTTTNRTALINFVGSSSYYVSIPTNGVYWNNILETSQIYGTGVINNMTDNGVAYTSIPLVSTTNGALGWTLTVTNLVNNGWGADTGHGSVSTPYSSNLTAIWPLVALEDGIQVGAADRVATLFL